MQEGIEKGRKGAAKTAGMAGTGVLPGSLLFLCLLIGGSYVLGIGRVQAAEETLTDHFILDKTEEFLTEEDVADMSVQVLAYAKYEILARSGIKFDSPELDGYFSGQSWYFGFISEKDFPEEMLDDIEAGNYAFLEEKQEQLGVYETDVEGFSYEPVESYVAEKEGKQAALAENIQSETAQTEQNAEWETESITADAAAQTQPETDGSSSEEYIFQDTDQRILSESEISALSLQAVCYAKNEIYARHGRKFVSLELQDYFNSKSWYEGTIEPADFSDAVFNSCELENIQLLSSREMALSGNSGYALDQPGYNINIF